LSDNLQILEATPLGYIGVAILGLILGSFYNVCIVRLPAEESVVFHGSRCPKCKSAIPWYLNIPVLSYLWLRGKCQHCSSRISIQYPLVEVSTSLLFLGLYFSYGLSIRFLAYSVFSSLLLIISVIDLYHQIIPDELSLPGLILGLIACFFTHDLLWWQSLLGILVGGGIFWLIAASYEKFSGREGLGGGDIKLLGMIGAWLGVQSILLVIVISSALGSVVGLSLMALRGRDFKSAIPFGPFLAVAALVYLLQGVRLQNLLFPDLP